MRILLLHQNFPGQFRSIWPHLKSLGHDLVAICAHDRPVEGDIRIIRYSHDTNDSIGHLGTGLWKEALERSVKVSQICHRLLGDGWQPDIVLAHPGWGETLAVREVLPNTPQIIWPELWLRPEHVLPNYVDDSSINSLNLRLEHIGRNCLTRASLTQADAWVLPTVHQAKSLPAEFICDKLHLIHEGIDLSIARPNHSICFELADKKITRSTPTITFVNRNLESLRGFDLFMRSLPEVMSARPDVRVLIVGGNESGYGTGIHQGEPLRAKMLKELGPQLDHSRIHFLGRVPYSQLIGIFQASTVHVYLSYPFIMGWSLLEAMACGCSIVGSEGPPVSEVIQHNQNGLLTPLSSPQALANSIITILDDPALRQRLSKEARITSAKYDKHHTLRKLASLVMAVASSSRA